MGELTELDQYRTFALNQIVLSHSLTGDEPVFF